MSAAGSAASPRWWVPGDWNGFFGLFTNVLLNVIVLTTLCLYVVQLPPDTVYGRVLPALGIALPIGNLFYAYLAWQLAKKEGRSDVTAMPYGPSVPHMFIVVLVVMLPTYLATKDAMLAYAAGLAWCLHHRRDRPAGLLRRAVDPQDDTARGDARHAGRHFHRLHLDAPGFPDVGSAVDRLRLLRHRSDRLDCKHPPARRNSRRPRGGDCRRCDRLACCGIRLERLHEGRRSRQGLRAIRPAPAVVLGRRVPRPGDNRAAAGHGDSVGNLQLHRGYEQRGERVGRRGQLQPAQDPGRRRHRARSSVRCWEARFRRRSISAIRAGNR